MERQHGSLAVACLSTAPNEHRDTVQEQPQGISDPDRTSKRLRGAKEAGVFIRKTIVYKLPKRDITRVKVETI